MSAPKKSYVTDIAEDISNRRLTFICNSSIDLYWQFTLSGIPISLDTVSHVYFIYSDDTHTTTVTGSVFDVSKGIVLIQIQPADLAIIGQWDWDIVVMDKSNKENITAYGDMVTIGKL